MGIDDYTVHCMVNDGIGENGFCKATGGMCYADALKAGVALWEHQNACRSIYSQVRDRIRSVSVWITNRKGNVVWNREFSSPSN